MDDERNTDNAWLENTVYNYHDEENVFSRYLFSVSSVLYFCLLEDRKNVSFWTDLFMYWYKEQQNMTIDNKLHISPPLKNLNPSVENTQHLLGVTSIQVI